MSPEDGPAVQVAAAWRYPVKSMAGEPVAELHLDRRGARGDRLWALRDVELNSLISARKLPLLLNFHARYLIEPDADSGPGRVPPVLITTPDGEEIDSIDPLAHTRLSDALDRDVRLEPLGLDRSAHRRSIRELASYSPASLLSDLGVTPDQAVANPARMGWRAITTTVRYATPPGGFVDLAPIHLLTESSLRAVGEHLDGGPPDPRRFRANLILTADGDDFVEAGWTEHDLTIGTTRLAVSMPTLRCVMPSRAQEGMQVDRALNRALATAAQRYLGIYADVSVAGRIAVGDEVAVLPRDRPGSVHRLIQAAGRASITGGVQTANLLRRPSARR